MAKRGKNEGSIRKRKDGLWEARYSIGVDPDGKSIRKSIYGKDREKVANKLSKALNEVNTGMYIEPSDLTVATWMDIWLKEYKRQSLKAKSYDSYKHTVDYFIKPAIGHVSLDALSPYHVQAMINEIKDRVPYRSQVKIDKYNKQIKDSKSDEEIAYLKTLIEKESKNRITSRTVEYTHRIIYGAMKQALKNNIVHRNICESVTLPREDDQSEPKAFTREDQALFMESIKSELYYLTFYMQISTGMRPGEVLGLKWENINFEAGEIYVRQTVSRVMDHGSDKSTLQFTPPKTKKSRRTIPILSTAVELLRQHKKEQAKHRLVMGSAYNNIDLVFATMHGNMIDTKNYSRYFKRALDRAGLEGYNLYSMRHTFATRGLEAGIPMKVMQELLGHSTMKMTSDTYSHVLEDEKKKNMNKLEGLF